MLKMVMLTEEQEKTLSQKYHEYTEREINDLALCASAVKDLAHMCVMFHIYSEGQKVINTDIYRSIFAIFEWLAEPVQDFLLEGAPMATKEPKEVA
jgi:hypothetical protein